ncbi:hypothetical protein BDF20DRAFT_933938 [Mycotypha africana]|uniref:uncharacterized protein n=1 Tax=Mycotypha africana TaxID=64632 RepID=UPI002301DE7E|nr:uncharacterized protein BDF20DRAFT_933938 [Mycotypha africana]KAI8984034.1 hypothetical protein BDF20DRAFT_933938 [Mycotypha africana]
MRSTFFLIVVVAALVAIASAAKLSTVSPSKKPLIKTLSKVSLPASSSKRMAITKKPVLTSTTRKLTPWQSHSNDPKWRASYKYCHLNNHPPRHDPRKPITTRSCPL